MPNWKKVIVSGSAAQLFNITSSGQVSASLGFIADQLTTGFIGTASFAGGVADDGVKTAAIADAQVTLAKMANMAANTVLVRNANSAGVPSAVAVTNTQLLIGDGTGFTAAALSGDATMANNGAVTIEEDAVSYAKMQNLGTANRVLGATGAGVIGEVQVVTAMIANDAIEEEQIGAGEVKTAALANDAVNADKLAANAVVNASIASNAAIAHSKLAALAATKVLVGNGSNVATEVVLSGDVSMNNAGAVTIGNGKILNAMLEDGAVDTEEIAASAVETAKINNAAVTLAKMANLAADKIIGRANGAGTGVPTALTATQVRTILNVADGATAGGGGIFVATGSAHSTTNQMLSISGSISITGSANSTQPNFMAISTSCASTASFGKLKLCGPLVLGSGGIIRDHAGNTGITVGTGTAGVVSVLATRGVTVGGGFGSTGASIASTGNIQTNGTFTASFARFPIIQVDGNAAGQAVILSRGFISNEGTVVSKRPASVADTVDIKSTKRLKADGTEVGFDAYNEDSVTVIKEDLLEGTKKRDSTHTEHSFHIGGRTVEEQVMVFTAKAVKATAPLTASGDISSSGKVIANSAKFGEASVHIDGPSGHVTASGHISSSLGFIGNLVGTASFVAADAITGASIVNDTINSEHYVAASIDNEHLADNAVGTAEIANDAVTYAKMQNLGTANRVLGATGAGVIGETQVVTAMIANDAIEEEQIGAGEVKTAALANDAVNADKLAANAVVNASIASNAAIAHTKLAALAATKVLVGNGSNVPTAVVLSGDVTMDNAGAVTIANTAVTNAMIGDGAVDTEELAADSVTAAKIGDNVINSEHYAAASIDNEHLADNAVGTDEIANDAVTYAKMQNLGTANRVLGATSTGAIGETQVVTAMIANDAVTADHIGNDVINSEHYAAASIDNEHLADDAVGADELASNAVVNASIAANAAIAHTKLAALASTKVLVGNGSNVPTAVVLSGDVTMDNAGAVTIANTAVTNAMIGDGAVDTEELAADSVTAAKIGNDVINSEHYAAASIDNEHLADNAVGTDEIADDAVTAAKLASNAVVNASIAAGAAIAHSKLAALAATKVLVGNGSNVAAEVALSGDVTMANNGAVTIAADAVSYAKMQNLGTANRVLGATSTGVIGETQVVAAMIGTDAVTAAKIGDNVINSEHYAAASIDNEHLADNAVGTNEIADDAVTGAKIENNPTIAGNLTVNGNTIFGNATTDTNLFKGNITSSGTSLSMSSAGFIITPEIKGAGTGITQLDVAGQITASSDISSSGYVHSLNIETFWTSFNVDGDGSFANSSYGPNTQGINFYHWNRNWTDTTSDSGDPTGDHVHRTEINSGWYVPYKIRIIGFAGGLSDGAASSTTTCTVKLFNTVAAVTSNYDSNTGTTKALVANSGNITLNGNRWRPYNITGLSVDLVEGQYVLPRITMGENLPNLRGQFTIKYIRIK